MRLKNIAFTALIFTVIGLGQASSSNAKQGAVEVHIKDSYGNEIPSSAVSAVTLTSTSGQDLSPKGFSGSIANLPFGDYVLRINVPGFLNWVGPLRIRKPLTRFTVGLLLGGIEGPNPTCAASGMITDTDAQGKWIRLLPLFANESFETNVATDGTFQLEGAECGKYILAVIRGQEVLRTLVVELTGRTKPVIINLADSK